MKRSYMSRSYGMSSSIAKCKNVAYTVCLSTKLHEARDVHPLDEDSHATEAIRY